jgi:hypothetical protein
MLFGEKSTTQNFNEFDEKKIFAADNESGYKK